MSESKRIPGAYIIPEKQEIDRRLMALEDLWKRFLKSEGQENLVYYIHKRNVFEVIKRHDQRMHYLRIFHGLDYPCEYKYIAIECFWLNTLKPFIVIDENSPLYDAPNEKFSLYLIISTIRAIFEIYKKGQKFIYPSDKLMREILYDFKYCSLSREAMISFVETFADKYGIGIEFILKNKSLINQTLKRIQISNLWTS